METIKLPKGVTVEINRQKYGGDVEIPASICPEKFKPVTKTPTRNQAKKQGEAAE
jgi:hypothetical protein